MPTRRFLACKFIAAALAVALFLVAGGLLATPPARADHIAGATYTGTHAGGGTVEFTISADGTVMTALRITDIPGNTCIWTILTIEGSVSPIENHSIAHESLPGQDPGGFFNASFPSPGNAEGTLEQHSSGVRGIVAACDSGTLTWSATAPVPATDTPTATPTATPTPTPTDTPTAAPTATPTPTPTYTPTLTSTPTDISPNTPTATNAPVSTATPAGQTGDVDCNGTISSIDAALILQLAAGLIASLPCSGNADVNRDGEIGPIDAALILQYAAGLIDILPA